jgi:hypothetical protein
MTITGKNGTTSESVFTRAFGCFATGSSKVKLSVAFGHILERWGRRGSGVYPASFSNGGMWLAGNTSLTPLMLVWE